MDSDRMGEQREPAAARQTVDDWTTLEGRHVEIEDNGSPLDAGRVEAVTPDGDILWLAQDGARHRRLVEKLAGRRTIIVSSQRPG